MVLMLARIDLRGYGRIGLRLGEVVFIGFLGLLLLSFFFLLLLLLFSKLSVDLILLVIFIIIFIELKKHLLSDWVHPSKI